MNIEFNMNYLYFWILCVVLLGIGVFALVKGSNIFVDGSSSIAKKMKVSPLIIGLTIVAFGTSFPELAVSVADSIGVLVKGDGANANIAIGNVVGSNIFNILVVLGLSAVFTPIVIKKEIIKKEYPILLFVTILLTIFGLLFHYNNSYAITRIEAIILLVLMALFMTYVIIDGKKQIKKNLEINQKMIEENQTKEMKTSKSILFIILGLIFIALGGQAVVTGAKNISMGIGKLAGLNEDLVESLVGVTVVAAGTSLPELVTSVIAAKKGENEIALGNVIGSNIFNILFILGVSGTITPLTIGNQIVVDLSVMIFATIIVFLFSIKGTISKTGGFIFLILYASYLTYLIINISK